MGMKLNDVNGDASELTYGFKATSRSLKPVHLAQVMFNHSLGYVHSPDTLFEFLEKPSKTPSEELDENIKARFEFTHTTADPDETLDSVRRTLRKVLANDNALYSSQRGSAPTCTSDWFIIDPTTGVSVGRFLHRLLVKSDGNIQDKLSDQLSDHHDSVSVLFRPLLKDADQSTATTKPWTEPELGDAFGVGGIADEFVDGYTTMSRHLKEHNGSAINYPRDLRRIVKFGSFALYAYMGNRHNELRSEGARTTRVPLVFNFTGDRNNPVADASLECVDTMQTEVRSTARIGVAEELDRRGYRSYSEDEILRQIEDQELLELKRNQPSKIDEDYATFRDMFTADPAPDTFEKLVNSTTDAIHTSRYKTYTPDDTIQTFGWRCGLLKPRGNRANERRLRPDPEVLESIILSVLEPEERRPLQYLCEELRERYGIIVGGTDEDRTHLDEWDIAIGASTNERDPLSNRNYEGFKQAVIDLGYAREFADGVTIVSTAL